MTDEEVRDFILLSPVITLADFVRNKQGFQQIAHRVRELSSAQQPEHIAAFSEACLAADIERISVLIR